MARTNAAIQERMDDAIEEASQITDRLRSDPEYLEGFATGMDEVRDRYYGDCGTLLTSSFAPDARSGKSSDWKRGYEDGQRLSYNLEILRKLKGCFAPVPPVPE